MRFSARQTRLGVATGLGLLAGISAWTYLGIRERDLLRLGEEIEIVAANRYIPAYARIEKNMLGLRKVPRIYVAQGSAHDWRELIGLQTLAPFTAGEPLLFNKLAAAGQSLAATVPEGKRATSLGVDAISGVEGLLRPGDLVDVYSLDLRASSVLTLLQAVPVLAVGQRYGPQDLATQNAPTSVTLALSPDQAHAALLAAARGPIHLALRGAGDNRSLPAQETRWSDAQHRARVWIAEKASPLDTTENFVPQKR